VERPGPLFRALLRLRLDPASARQLLSELAELHEVRTERDGLEAADRWLRREKRRIAWGLTTGRLNAGAPDRLRVPTNVARPLHASGLDGLRDALTTLVRSARSLTRTPILASAVVLTVGLGIGGTTLVWSTVHAVLVAPLPYPDADRVVLLRTIRGSDRWGTSMADVEAVVQDRPAAFDAVAAYHRGTPSVLLGDRPELLDATWVTAGFFPLLGIEPLLGRGFTVQESRDGGSPVVLLSAGLWERAFDRSPEVMGRTVSIEGTPHTVVGVLPRELGPLTNADLYPALQVVTPPRKGPFFYPMLARLAPGADAAVARSQLADLSARMFPRWQSSFPTDDAVLGFDALKPAVVGDASRMLPLILGAAAFLLLVAAANAAGLLVARAAARRRELAVRVAVGASRARILGLVFAEAAVLALASGALGLVLAGGGMELLHRFGSSRLPRVDEVGFTGPVAAVFLALVVGSCLLLGGIAAASVLGFGRGRSAGPSGGSSLAASATRTTASPAARGLRRALVAVQFAVAIPLLVAAGLLGRSLHHIEAQGPGFDTERVVSMTVALPPAGFPDPPDIRGFWSELLPRLEALPGVAAAGIADARPPMRYGGGNNFVLEGQPTGAGAPQAQSPWITASPGFLEVLDVGVLEGRTFAPTADTMRHAVVDEAWADRYVADGSPVGLRFRSGGCTIDGCPWVEIVGVVESVKTTGFDHPDMGVIYYDFLRDSHARMHLHLRTTRDPMAVVPAVRELVRERDPAIPVDDVRTAAQLTDELVVGRRTTGALLGLLALLALALSAVGIYGAMATLVRQRMRETGIRIALGAAPGRALGEVVSDGLKVAAAGTALGIVGAVLLTRTLGGLLYEVTPLDPLVFGAVGAVTLLVAGVATAIPGRRAAATDPAATLRED